MKSKYIRLVRPVAWIVFLLPLSVGFGIGATKNTDPFHIIFALIAFVSWMSFSFILNSLSDKDVDSLKKDISKADTVNQFLDSIKNKKSE